MTCKNCNAPLEDQARFCVKCGARVSQFQEDQAAVARPPDDGKTVVQPRRVTHPIRPPKRPVQPSQRQEVDVTPWDKLHEQSVPLASPESVYRQVSTGDNADAGSVVYEQPTTFLPMPLEPYAATPAPKDSLYDQPTIIVKRDSLDELKAGQEIASPTTPRDVPILPQEVTSIPHPELIEPEELGGMNTEGAAPLSALDPSEPLLYYQLNTTAKGSRKLPAVVNRATYTPRRRRGGCFLGCLTTLIVLLLILGGVWIFALRPYAHNMAQRELDQALTSAVNQVPGQARLLPPGSTIPVNENSINNLIVLNLAPSNPIQHPTTSISTKNIRLDFQLYNFPCAVTMVPVLDNGRLAVSQVNIEGIFSAIMSPEEMTALLNKHLNDAQFKLQRTISSVQLKDHEMDLTLS